MKSPVQTPDKLQDADVPSKEPLQRPQDVLILLIVISVLSTLLAVIVIISCIWICYKFYIQPPLCNATRGTRFRVQPEGSFPPPRRDNIEMQDLAGRLNSLLQERDPRLLGHDRTSTSKELGYKDFGYNNLGFIHKPNSNFSVPLLSGPSLTPSPNQQIGKTQGEFHDERLDHSRNHYTCDPYRHYVRGPRMYERERDFCPEELSERLAQLNRNENISRKLWDSQRRPKSPRAPANTPSTTPFKSTRPKSPCAPSNTPSTTPFKSTYGPDTSEVDESSHRNFPRRKIGKRTSFVGNCFENSLNQSAHGNVGVSEHGQGAKKQKPRGSSSPKFRGLKFLEPSQRNQSTFGRAGAVPKTYRMEISPQETKHSGAQVNMPPEKRNLSAPHFSLHKVPKRKFKNFKKKPSAVFIESPSSNSSSELAPTSNSKTYMKLYHPSEEETIYMEADEDESCRDESSESTPSMSWDHLTPEPSPTQLQLPNILVDPAQGTVFYINDRIYQKSDTGFSRDCEKCEAENNESSKAG